MAGKAERENGQKILMGQKGERYAGYKKSACHSGHLSVWQLYRHPRGENQDRIPACCRRYYRGRPFSHDYAAAGHLYRDGGQWNISQHPDGAKPGAGSCGTEAGTGKPAYQQNHAVPDAPFYIPG